MPTIAGIQPDFLLAQPRRSAISSNRRMASGRPSPSFCAAAQLSSAASRLGCSTPTRVPLPVAGGPRFFRFCVKKIWTAPRRSVGVCSKGPYRADDFCGLALTRKRASGRPQLETGASIIVGFLACATEVPARPHPKTQSRPALEPFGLRLGPLRKPHVFVSQSRPRLTIRDRPRVPVRTESTPGVHERLCTGLDSFQQFLLTAGRAYIINNFC